MNSEILITILVIVLVIITIDLAVQSYRLTTITKDLADKALDAEKRASNHFSKIMAIDNEVNKKDLSEMTHLELYNSYKEIKKVITKKEN